MSFTVQDLPAIIVIGKEIRTNNQICLPAMQGLWQTILTTNTLDAIPNRKNDNAVYGVYTDYAPDFKIATDDYSYTVGMHVTTSDAVPAGMVVKQVPAATYAVFACAPSEIGATWQTIWATPLQRTFIGDFEEYDFTNTSQVKIYIGIEPVAL